MYLPWQRKTYHGQLNNLLGERSILITCGLLLNNEELIFSAKIKNIADLMYSGRSWMKMTKS